MKTISRTLRVLAATALATTVLLSQALASPIVSISPVTQTIGVGGFATIDIIVSGLTDPTGGFALTLSFNNTILSGESFANDPGPPPKMGASPLDLSGGFSGNTLDLFFVADMTETEASLAASEGGGFTLATVTFKGLVDGLSPLTLSNVVLSTWDGGLNGGPATLAGVEAVNGSVCVGGNCGPEPGSMLLVATALGALAIRRRKQAA